MVQDGFLTTLIVLQSSPLSRKRHEKSRITKGKGFLHGRPLMDRFSV